MVKLKGEVTFQRYKGVEAKRRKGTKEQRNGPQDPKTEGSESMGLSGQFLKIGMAFALHFREFTPHKYD